MKDLMLTLQLFLILVVLIMIGCILNDIRNDRIMRVTKVEHNHYIEHFYGDLHFKEKTNVRDQTETLNRPNH